MTCLGQFDQLTVGVPDGVILVSQRETGPSTDNPLFVEVVEIPNPPPLLVPLGFTPMLRPPRSVDVAVEEAVIKPARLMFPFAK